MSDAPKCPPFGVGSVDFASFHEALRDGADPEEALAHAKGEKTLNDKTKDELIDLAEERGVEVSKSDRKAKIIDAIEADGGDPA